MRGYLIEYSSASEQNLRMKFKPREFARTKPYTNVRNKNDLPAKEISVRSITVKPLYNEPPYNEVLPITKFFPGSCSRISHIQDLPITKFSL